MTFTNLYVIISAVISLANPCVIEESRIVKNLATKTPYEYLKSNENLVSLPENCKPSKFWLMSRHGTRYPSKKGINGINYILPEILNKIDLTKNSQLCENDLKLLRSWTPQVNISQAKNLHAEGEKELILMAESYANKFPQILKQPYSPEKFEFRATNTERARKSAFNFATGLFDRKIAQEVEYYPPIKPHDPLIRFYKMCEKWKNDVKLNPKSLQEQKLFENSETFQTELIQPLSELLTQNLTMDQIDAIWVACTFGQAWNPNKLSPWCGIFTKHRLELMEFREDLEYYWVDSYGQEVNFKPACVLLNDVIEKFESENSKDNILYFSHSGAILKLLAFLGIDKPKEDLKHDSNIRKRLWGTSKIDSFASNIAFVLLKPCNQIGLLINESLTPICDDEKLWCDFDEFKQKFPKCDFDQICDNSNDFKNSENLLEDDRY